MDRRDKSGYSKNDVPLSSIVNEIAEKEKEKEACSKFLETPLSSLKQEKSKLIEKKKEIDEELARLYSEISVKRECLSKHQTNLQYKDEKKLNDGIQALEYQLMMHNFPVREEKRLVSEIDQLKRSKKLLKEYCEIKVSLDSLKNKQMKLKVDRDKLYEEIGSVKQRIDQHIKARSELDKLNEALSKLKLNKQSLVKEFKQKARLNLSEKTCFDNVGFWKDESRHKSVSNSKSVGETQIVHNRLISGNSVNKISTEVSDVCMCNILISYVSKFLDMYTPTPVTPTCKSVNDMEATGSNTVSGHDKIVGKNSKGKRCKTKARILSHPPEIISYFLKLNVPLPRLSTQVPDVYDSLIKLHNENLLKSDDQKLLWTHKPEPNQDTL